MDKVIPILPCPDIKKQVEFYRQLGFEVTGLYTSPNPYATIQLGSIELHFWGSRKNVPTENASMCFIQVEDVEAVYNIFVSRLKEHFGKVPRSGIPKISKVRDLVSDRRFTLTDPGGNTVFMGTPKKSSTHNFFRTLQDEKHANKFAILYDVLYSKEDPALAAGTLSRYGIDKDLLVDLDKAKYLLVLLEIQRALGRPPDDAELKALLEIHQGKNDDWTRIKNKYSDILEQE
jgi:hypothetical protein